MTYSLNIWLDDPLEDFRGDQKDGDRSAAINKKSIFAFLRNGFDLSALPPRGEVSIQQTLINEIGQKETYICRVFFQDDGGDFINPGRPPGLAPLDEVCDRCEFGKLGW